MTTIKRTTTYLITCGLITLLSNLAVAQVGSASAGWTISQLTNGISVGPPQLSGSNVVWEEWDGNDTEIFMFNGNLINQLTDNDIRDEEPYVSGSNVVWQGRLEDGNREIFFHNGTTPQQISNSPGGDLHARISGNNVVWWQVNGDQIKHFDGALTTTISNGASVDPEIDGNTVVWRQFDGNDVEIFMHKLDTSITTQISDNNFVDVDAKVSGNRAVWLGNPVTTNSAREIYVFDGNHEIQVTNANERQFNPSIFGDRAAWSRLGDILLYDFNTGSTVTIPTSSINNARPQLSDSLLAWSGFDGNDNEIYVFDGHSVFQLTDNDYDDIRVQVDGTRLAWLGDNQVFTAIPEPNSLLLLLTGGLIMTCRRRRHH